MTDSPRDTGDTDEFTPEVPQPEEPDGSDTDVDDPQANVETQDEEAEQA